MELSKEQQISFDKYVKGYNIFITGPGGSGKSALIRKIKEHCKKSIQVCALTGCAAVLLNCKAKTLHSWSGIGLGNGTIEQNIKKIQGSKYKKQIWQNTDILIVDEVSMLSLKLFDMLNEIGKATRKNPRPFGGIQLIFSGDFYQLPPVGNKDDLDTQRFCFESDNWNTIFNQDCQIQLIKIFRQTDEIYSSILNQIREGKIKKKSNELLLQYVGREADENLVVEPTKLFPTKNKVEYINNSKMCSLSSEEKEYTVLSQKARASVDARLLTSFDRIRKNFRNGLAVVPVVRDACGGCFNAIPPQRQSEIRQHKKIIVCENCGRILVEEEVNSEK